MIRIGFVDFDTSHVVEFTKRLNHVNIDKDQWVHGAKVVAGCPMESRHSPELVPQYTRQMQEMGVEVVDNIEDLMGMIDAVCIEANDGGVHLERARPFIEAGIPCYIDKPFETDLERAKEIMRLARDNGVPTFSSSSLRFAPEVQQAIVDPEVGAILGADVWTQAREHEINPGLFNYGIHGVEILYTLMNGGCQKISCAYRPGGEVVTGIWDDDRIGVLRGTRASSPGFGFMACGEKSIHYSGISIQYIYRELLKQIVKMFETKETPIDPMITLEIVAFIVGAIDSRKQDGAWVDLDLSL